MSWSFAFRLKLVAPLKQSLAVVVPPAVMTGSVFLVVVLQLVLAFAGAS